MHSTPQRTTLLTILLCVAACDSYSGSATARQDPGHGGEPVVDEAAELLARGENPLGGRTDDDVSRPPRIYPPGTDVPERGFYVRGQETDRFRFVKWESEETINKALDFLKRKEGSCAIQFAPGDYEIESRIFVNEVQNLTISGIPGVRLHFADGPNKTTAMRKAAEAGSATIEVEHPERLVIGRRYQVYREDGRWDRILEFEVKEVVDGVVHLRHPVHFFPHVKEVPVGSQVMAEMTFFRVRQSPGFTLQGIYMDGRHRGGIRGHTTYCGVHANGLYKAHQRATHTGFTVRNCTFKNLKGRGVVFYGLGEGLVENNEFEFITAQAIEIDHFSQGIIRGNHVNGAEVGVMVNDAYESIVEGNVLRNCGHGVRFLEIYDDPWVNSGNIIRDNVIGPGCAAGVHFFSEGMNDNLITGNHFLGLGDKYKVVNGEGNQIEFVDAPEGD